MHNCENSIVPIQLPREFVLIKASEVRFTCSTENIINTDVKTMFKCNIKPNCNSFENSYFNSIVVIWNKLPFDIRQVPSLSGFKSEVTKFLWSVDMDWPD